jgi:hypothetical protein
MLTLHVFNAYTHAFWLLLSALGTVLYLPPKPHHVQLQTLPPPLLLLCRLDAAGWGDCQLLTKQQLSAKYGVEHAQPILIGNV